MRLIKRHTLVKPATEFVIDAPTPSNISYWWNVGSLLGLSLVIQIITGVTLAMHYNANVLEAFNSVEHIMRDVNNGWLIRYLHSNTASAFFFLVYLHIGRGLYYGSYKAPRTLTWILGTTILILMMATAFLGYVLPYGQMSLWGATVITNLMSAIPWIGQDIVEFVWGGFSVNNATLNRFFSLHFVLPFILAALALMHLIALHDSAGANNPLGISGNYDRVPFAPYFIFKDIITIFIFMWVLSVFVFFVPNVLGDSENYVMANPMQTPPAIVPEWYLLPFYAILRSIPNKLVGVIAMFSAILIILAMTFGDIAKLRGNQFKPLTKGLFFLFIGNLLLLLVLGAKHVESPFIEAGQLATLIYFVYFGFIVPMNTTFENSINEFYTFMKNIVINLKNKLDAPSPFSSVGLPLRSVVPGWSWVSTYVKEGMRQCAGCLTIDLWKFGGASGDHLRKMGSKCPRCGIMIPTCDCETLCPWYPDCTRKDRTQQQAERGEALRKALTKIHKEQKAEEMRNLQPAPAYTPSSEPSLSPQLPPQQVPEHGETPVEAPNVNLGESKNSVPQWVIDYYKERTGGEVSTHETSSTAQSGSEERYESEDSDIFRRADGSTVKKSELATRKFHCPTDEKDWKASYEFPDGSVPTSRSESPVENPLGYRKLKDVLPEDQYNRVYTEIESRARQGLPNLYPQRGYDFYGKPVPPAPDRRIKLKPGQYPAMPTVYTDGTITYYDPNPRVMHIPKPKIFIFVPAAIPVFLLACFTIDLDIVKAITKIFIYVIDSECSKIRILITDIVETSAKDCVIACFNSDTVGNIIRIFAMLANKITVECDAPTPWGLYFQDTASPQMEALTEFHDSIMYFLTGILFSVGWIMLACRKFFKSVISRKYTNHGSLVEIIWTISPGIILVLIAFTSFKLLYLMDEVSDVNMTLYIEGHQWYWSYQYPDFLDDDGEFIEYDSYLTPESDLENGALRMLDVDERVIIPEITHVRFIVTSGDVIHCYACPSLGIKADAYPGRLNQASALINRLGTFYGQCSEICGILHSSMPISIESVSLEKFLLFLWDK